MCGDVQKKEEGKKRLLWTEARGEICFKEKSVMLKQHICKIQRVKLSVYWAIE